MNARGNGGNGSKDYKLGRYGTPIHPHYQSAKWKLLRAAALEETQGRCMWALSGGCDKPGDIVHHLTYEHFGDERQYELVALCESHHGWFRDEPRMNRELLELRKKLFDARTALAEHKERVKKASEKCAEATDRVAQAAKILIPKMEEEISELKERDREHCKLIDDLIKLNQEGHDIAVGSLHDVVRQASEIIWEMETKMIAQGLSGADIEWA